MISNAFHKVKHTLVTKYENQEHNDQPSETQEIPLCLFWSLLSKDSHHHVLQSHRSGIVLELLSHVLLFVTPWSAAHQASLYFTISQSLLKLMPIELVMSSNHLILCHPLLLLPSSFPSIRVFANESVLHIRRPKSSLQLIGWGPPILGRRICFP